MRLHGHNVRPPATRTPFAGSSLRAQTPSHQQPGLERGLGAQPRSEGAGARPTRGHAGPSLAHRLAAGKGKCIGDTRQEVARNIAIFGEGGTVFEGVNQTFQHRAGGIAKTSFGNYAKGRDCSVHGAADATCGGRGAATFGRDSEAGEHGWKISRGSRREGKTAGSCVEDAGGDYGIVPTVGSRGCSAGRGQGGIVPCSERAADGNGASWAHCQTGRSRRGYTKGGAK
mmetsp:Transcript_19322/g.40739  ORF Transcript_19322/g.40739 Transcript_19322/m.40739 type:complete len:228 (-) Transcript_19322:102-785(-)